MCSFLIYPFIVFPLVSVFDDDQDDDDNSNNNNNNW